MLSWLASVSPERRVEIAGWLSFLGALALGLKPFDGIVMIAITGSGLLWLWASILSVKKRQQIYAPAVYNSLAASLAVLAGFSALSQNLPVELQKTLHLFHMAPAARPEAPCNCSLPATSAGQFLPPALPAQKPAQQLSSLRV